MNDILLLLKIAPDKRESKRTNSVQIEKYKKEITSQPINRVSNTIITESVQK